MPQITLIRKLQLGLLVTLASTSLFAYSGRYFVAGSLGAGFSSIENGSQRYTYAGGNFTDTYRVNGKEAVTLLAGVRGGFEFDGRGRIPAIAVGLGLYDTPTGYEYSGLVSEAPLGDPEYLLYRYTYNITVIRLMLEAQFIWHAAQWQPFILLGIGPSWNRLNGYEDSPVTQLGFAALPPFATSTTTALACEIGAGVAYQFTSQDRVAIEYRYVNTGSSSFGSRGTAYPFSLNPGRLSENDVLLTYTHLI
jgi:opacity protein-like surface antigen